MDVRYAHEYTPSHLSLLKDLRFISLVHTIHIYAYCSLSYSKINSVKNIHIKIIKININLYFCITLISKDKYNCKIFLF